MGHLLSNLMAVPLLAKKARLGPGTLLGRGSTGQRTSGISGAVAQPIPGWPQVLPEGKPARWRYRAGISLDVLG
jgi:hypothetical protein